MKHLIEDNEAIAILETSGANKETVRRFAQQLGAAEATISDVAVYRLLTENIGLPAQAAGRMLLNLREIRQGSRDTVIGH